MLQVELGLRLLVVLLAAVSVIAIAFQRDKQPIHIVWAIFCASLAISMAEQAAGNRLGNYQYLVALGACATCNGFWLVSCALFRPDKPFTPWRLCLVGWVAFLVIAQQLVRFAQGAEWIGTTMHLRLDAGLNEMLGLFGSAVLVLIIREGIVGWGSANRIERRMRVVFLAYIGCCIASATLAAGLANSWPIVGQALGSVQAVAAAVCIVMTSLLIRMRVQLDRARIDQAELTVAGVMEECEADAISTVALASPSWSEEELALAKQLRRHVEAKRLFLESELKVADIATQLSVPEYRVSRAITGPLQQKNFNRWINRYRVEHSKSLLRDPDSHHWPVLVIGIESGFGSVGPFNRAFKEIVGQTPSCYRNQSRQFDLASRAPAPGA